MRKLGMMFILLIVVVLSGFTFIWFTEGRAAFSTAVYKLKDQQILRVQGINKYEIISPSTDINILPSSQSEIALTLNGEVSEKMKDAYDIQTEVKNKTLQIKVIRTKSPSFTVFAINKNVKLDVLLPENVIESLYIKTKSGDIFAKDLTTKRLLLETSSGDIKGDSISGEQSLSIKTASGDVEIEPQVKSFTLDILTSSGDIDVNIPETQFQKKTENRYLGKKGNGKVLLKFRTKSGDLKIKQ